MYVIKYTDADCPRYWTGKLSTGWSGNIHDAAKYTQAEAASVAAGLMALSQPELSNLITTVNLAALPDNEGELVVMTCAGNAVIRLGEFERILYYARQACYSTPVEFRPMEKATNTPARQQTGITSRW